MPRHTDSNSKKVYILLLENNKLYQMAFVNALKLRKNYRADLASNYYEAIAKLKSGKEYGLIIVDLILDSGPGGLDLLAWLRKNRPGLPVIINTWQRRLARRISQENPDFDIVLNVKSSCREGGSDVMDLLSTIDRIVNRDNPKLDFLRRWRNILHEMAGRKNGLTVPYWENTADDKHGALNSMSVFVYGLPERELRTSVYRYHFYGRDQVVIAVPRSLGCNLGCIFCKFGQERFLRPLEKSEIYPIIVNGLYSALVQEISLKYGRPKICINFTHGGDMLYHGFRQGMEMVRQLSEHPANFEFIVSTIGQAENLQKMINDYSNLPVTIYLSLHFVDKINRHAFMPGSAKNEIIEMIDLTEKFGLASGRVPTVSFMLIPGINTGPEYVKKAADILKGRDLNIKLMANHAADVSSPEFMDQELRRNKQLFMDFGIPEEKVRIRRHIGLQIPHCHCGTAVGLSR